MKNIFHRLSFIRIVIAAFLAIVVPYYAHAAATIKLDTELQIRSESDELALAATSLEYNPTTGFYDTDNSKYVTIYNKDLDDYSLFWCWDNSASGASDYFDYKKCSPYSVGIIIPSGQDVSTITLKLYKQATDFNWIRISYATNGGTYGAGYNNYYTWPRFCTNRATCTMPDPDGVFVRSGYKFDGWDASALHSTLTGAGAIAAGGTLGGQYITAKKDVTIKATWELAAIKANVTIAMNGSVSNPPKLPGDCTSDSCYTPYDAPTRYGYDFTGWMVSVNGVVTDVSADNNLAGIYEDIASVIPNDSATSVAVVLTAQWDPKDVSINYACSTDGGIVDSKTLKFDENFTVLPKAESNNLCPKANYDVAYWQYNDDRYDLGATYNIDSLGYQLVPVYTPKTYKITYDCGDGGTLLAGYNNIYDVVFKESYATAGRICQKDGYVQTGWQTPNAATGGYYEYELDTEQSSYGFYSDRTFTAIYTPIQSYTITYDCGDGKLVVTDDATQTVNTLEKYTVKPKTCDQPGFIHSGWQDPDGNTLNFYTEYEYTYDNDITLTATYRNDPDVPCYITFTSQYDVTNMPADMELQTGSTPTDPVQVPMLTSGFDKRFDGWSYYDSEHNMYFKYFDLNGNPVRSLDYDHCTKGMELQAQWVEANNCTKKDIYTYSDGTSPVRTVYYSVVENDDGYATSGQIYSDARCENPVAITESDLANIIPTNSTYNGIYGHYNVANAGSTTDIACIRTNGDFANVEYCRKEYDTTNEEDMIWYVKYTCNDGYKEFNKQCVRATKVYFNGNAGDGAAASGGAAYSEQIMYYGQALPEISRDTTPTLAGYKFMGWYDGPDYATSTRYYNANEQPVAGTWNKNTDTATLYAGWQPVVYTVIYDCGAGTLNGAKSDTATWKREFIVAGPGRCSLANHVLTGWDAMPENTTDVSGTHPAGTKIPAWSYGTNMKFVAKYATQTDIDFDNNGGIGGEMGLTPDPVIATYGMVLPEISPNNPTREGYTFTGWYDKDGEKYYNVDATPAVDAWDKKDAKVTLYAGWAGDTYTVTYDCTQYASDYNPYDQVEATLGESYTLAPSDRCLRTEYNLNQWVLTLENGTEVKFTPGTTVPEWTYIGDVTLVAEWTKTSVIYFDPMGGEGYSLTQSAPVVYGEQLPEIQSVPTKTGYTFTGWYDAVGKQYYNERNQAMVDSWDKKDATTYLYAHWDPKTYTVTYDCGDGELSGDKTGTATYDSDFTIANADRCQMSNHVLSEWEIMKSYNNEVLDTYKPGSKISPWKYETNMKLRAKYATQTEITFDNNGGVGGEMGQPGVTSTATYGWVLPEISPDNPTRTGYQFIGWYDGTDYATSTRYYDASGKPTVPTWDKTDAKVTLYAGWKAAPTIVSFNLNGGMGTTPNTVDATYGLALPEISSNNPTREGHQFMGWYDGTNYATSTQYYDASGKPTASPWNKTDATTTLYAGWKANTTTVSFNLNGGSGTAPETVTATYEVALPNIDATTLTRTGYEFMGWYDGTNYATSTQYYTATGAAAKNTWDKTDATTTLYAGWKARQVTITFEYHNGVKKRTYSIDESVTLPTFTELGWTTNQYSNWYGWRLTKGIDDTLDVHEGVTVESVFIDDAYTQNQNIIATPLFENISYTTLRFFESEDDSTPETLGTTCTNQRCVLPINTKYTKTGHVFSGWDVRGVGELAGVFYANDDLAEYIAQYTPETLDIYVNWVPETYRLSYSCGNNTPSNIPAGTVTFGDTYTLPNDGGCTATGSKQKGWIINNVIYDLGDEFVWDIDLGTPGTQYTIMPAWEDFWETALVAYMDDNSSTNKTLDAVCNSKTCILPDNIYAANEKLGYTFNGWSVDGIDGIVSAGDNIAQYINADTPKRLKIVAQWEPNEYTLTYHCGDGNGTPPAPQPITYNTLFTFAQNTCTKDGYNFAGWGIESKIGQPGQNAGWQYTSDMTAVARWEQNTKFVVTLNPNGGSGGTQSVNVTYNEIMPNISNLPTRQYYEFQGFVDEDGVYYYNDAGTAIKQWPVLGNGVLTAVWEPYTFTATYNCGDGSNPPHSQSARYGEEFTLAENTCTRDGYKFAGWAIDGKSVPNSFEWKFTVPTEFTAQWTANSNYTVTLNPNNGTTRVQQLSNVVFDSFMSDVDIPTRTGYVFDGYYYDNVRYFDNMGHCVRKYDVPRDSIMLARWTPKQYTAMYDCDNGTDIQTVPQPISYGSSYTLSNSGICTKSGYTFAGWQAAGTNNIFKAGTNILWQYDNNTTFVAQWDKKIYTAYIQYDGNGADGGDNPEKPSLCTSGTPCYLPVNTFTKTGYEFKKWKVTYGTRSSYYSADTDISGLIISDNQTLNVTAQWTPIDYTVSYDANGGNSTLSKTICTIEGCNPVTNDNIGTYMTRAGYIFKNWTTDTKTGVIANLSNGIRQDTTLYAMWDACPVGTFKTADVAATTACTSCVTLSDDDTNTNYERTGAPASTSANDCIAQCKPIELRGGIAKPTQASVKFPAKCEYTGVSINGNTCEINFELGTCVETECRMGYELVNDQCVKCPDENAIAYHKKNSCDIKQCVPGYHVDVNNLRQCVPNVVDCTADINNAVAATKVWDDNRHQYGICTPIECDYDHHIEDGQCLLDEKQCELAHGSGHQEWNYRTNTWSECIVDQCDPGYTNDPTLTDDKDYAQCGRCANTYDKKGNVAASSFVQECEIATCMYQGQKYILTADNECMSVCENLSDETGEMWWDNATKTCKRVCAPGYKQWN